MIVELVMIDFVVYKHEEKLLSLM